MYFSKVKQQINFFEIKTPTTVAYLFEDGPELMLQYLYVDKYSGTKYDEKIYKDGYETDGRLTVLGSSVISFMIALFR